MASTTSGPGVHLRLDPAATAGWTSSLPYRIVHEAITIARQWS